MQTSEKILSLNDLKAVVSSWKEKGLKVVFTNGCFDILHIGHVDYLEKSRQKGNKLVVGLNTDKSVTKLKGIGRPINNETTRARILASLLFVDAVTLFDEQTPFKLIRDIIPDILVKGNDYLEKDIVGYDIVVNNGGKVETIEITKGYSTTDIIQKIKKIQLP